MSCDTRSPTIILLPELDAEIRFRAPFVLPYKEELVLLSDYTCDDRIAVSLSDSIHVFSPLETGFFRQYPNRYLGIIISHRRQECLNGKAHQIAPQQVQEMLDNLADRDRRLHGEKTYRNEQWIRCRNTDFILYCETLADSTGPVQVCTAMNNLVRLEVINSKTPMEDPAFDSMALQLVRSVEIR